MLTARMNIKEVKDELARDMAQILNFLDKRENKYKRAVLKSKKFPLYFAPYFYRSARKNEWVIMVEVNSRKAIKSDMSKVTFVCLLNHANGYYAFTPSWVDGRMIVAIYAPHFFSRFGKRAGIELQGKGLIARFFKHNASLVFDLTPAIYKGLNTIEVAGSVKEGVCLGVEIEGGVFFKTFITYDMLKGEQVEKYTKNEQLRQEIHEKNDLVF